MFIDFPPPHTIRRLVYRDSKTVKYFFRKQTHGRITEKHFRTKTDHVRDITNVSRGRELTVSANHENSPIVHFAYRLLSLYSALRRRFRFVLARSRPRHNRRISLSLPPPAGLAILAFRFRVFRVRLYVRRDRAERAPRHSGETTVSTYLTTQTAVRGYSDGVSVVTSLGGGRGDRECGAGRRTTRTGVGVIVVVSPEAKYEYIRKGRNGWNTRRPRGARRRFKYLTDSEIRCRSTTRSCGKPLPYGVTPPPDNVLYFE